MYAHQKPSPEAPPIELNAIALTIACPVQFKAKKSWRLPTGHSVPIAIADPTSIPVIRDHQTVSVTKYLSARAVGTANTMHAMAEKQTPMRSSSAKYPGLCSPERSVEQVKTANSTPATKTDATNPEPSAFLSLMLRGELTPLLGQRSKAIAHRSD